MNTCKSYTFDGARWDIEGENDHKRIFVKVDGHKDDVDGVFDAIEKHLGISSFDFKFVDSGGIGIKPSSDFHVGGKITSNLERHVRDTLGRLSSGDIKEAMFVVPNDTVVGLCRRLIADLADEFNITRQLARPTCAVLGNGGELHILIPGADGRNLPGHHVNYIVLFCPELYEGDVMRLSAGCVRSIDDIVVSSI